MKTRLIRQVGSILFLSFACYQEAICQLDMRGMGVTNQVTKYGIDTNKIDTAMVYLYTKSGAATTKQEYADYYRRYRLLQESPQIFRIKEYWMDGTLKKTYNSMAHPS